LYPEIDVDGNVTTLAGLCNKRAFHPVFVQGDVNKAELMAPRDILVTKNGEVVFSDGRLHRIIKGTDNKVTTIAGSGVVQPNNLNMGGCAKEGYRDGKALTALFNFPLGCDMDRDSKQNIYVIDGGNACIRKLSADGMVTTLAKRTHFGLNSSCTASPDYLPWLLFYTFRAFLERSLISLFSNTFEKRHTPFFGCLIPFHGCLS
jgi:hypothetical protein